MSIQFRNFDERVQISQLQSENAIPEVMPIDDDFASGDPADQPHQGKSGNTWRILEATVFEQMLVAQLDSYLHHDKLGWTWNDKYQGIQDGDYLICNFDRSS
jgi:hypothetical protein